MADHPLNHDGSSPVGRLSRRALLRALGLGGAGALAAASAGCGALGFVLHAAGEPLNRRFVKAPYGDLVGRKVAVMTAPTDDIRFYSPKASIRTTATITQRLKAVIDPIQLVEPRQIERYQQDQPEWNTYAYSRLMKELGVDRLVYVDLTQWTLQEPGNRHVWQGRATGNIGVAEADGANPNGLAFHAIIRAMHPTNTTVGVLNADPQTIELGLLARFAAGTARLFYDHWITPDA